MTAMLRRCVGALLAVLLAGPVVAARAGTAFNAESFTLANGMAVVVVSNHRAPVVHHAVWYRIGAADEPPGKSGIAHMLEHMMFKGTDTIPPGEFSKIIARNGGNDNAFTAQDYTGYFQNIASDRLEMVMAMEAERMVGLRFAEADFLTERDVVLEERRSRTDNDPRAQFAEQLSAVQYLAHPYRLPIIGWEHEIRALSRDDAFALYRQAYAPNNAVLLVVGDVTVDDVRKLAEKTYGQVVAREIAPRQRVQEPPQRASRRVEMQDPRVANPEWMRQYLAPSYRAGASEHVLPLEVLTQILGGASTSRLYQALVVEGKLATYAGSYYSGLSYDQTTFNVYAMPRPGVTMAAIEQAVDAELTRLLKAGVDAEELARAKFNLKAQAVFARDSLYGIARIFGSALTSGMTVEDVEAWPDRVEAVTADQVLAAAHAVLRNETSVTGVLSAAETPPS
jgi:zinc protease